MFLIGTKEMRYTHHASESVEMPFVGPVAEQQDPRAHGNITVLERCACGAMRLININGLYREVGPWEFPLMDDLDLNGRDSFLLHSKGTSGSA